MLLDGTFWLKVETRAPWGARGLPSKFSSVLIQVGLRQLGATALWRAAFI